MAGTKLPKDVIFTSLGEQKGKVTESEVFQLAMDRRWKVWFFSGIR